MIIVSQKNETCNPDLTLLFFVFSLIMSWAENKTKQKQNQKQKNRVGTTFGSLTIQTFFSMQKGKI